MRGDSDYFEKNIIFEKYKNPNNKLSLLHGFYTRRINAGRLLL